MSGLATTEHQLELQSEKLHINLLGPPEIRWRGEPLVMLRRQARAMLYYLAVASQSIPRDRLSYLFWPDVGEATARHNLSRLVTILHNALPDSGLLITRDDQITSAVSVDRLPFKQGATVVGIGDSLQRAFGNPVDPGWLLSDGLHPSLAGHKAIVTAFVEQLSG